MHLKDGRIFHTDPVSFMTPGSMLRMLDGAGNACSG